MKQFSRILCLVICTAVVLTVLAAPASAACRIRCVTGFSTSPTGTEPSDWGMGPDCASADADFRNHALGTADNNCANNGYYDGACNVSFVITSHTDNPWGVQGCFYNGMWQVDGYANHGCWREICLEPIEPYQ